MDAEVTPKVAIVVPLVIVKVDVIHIARVDALVLVMQCVIHHVHLDAMEVVAVAAEGVLVDVVADAVELVVLDVVDALPLAAPVVEPHALDVQGIAIQLAEAHAQKTVEVVVRVIAMVVAQVVVVVHAPGVVALDAHHLVQRLVHQVVVLDALVVLLVVHQHVCLAVAVDVL